MQPKPYISRDINTVTRDSNTRTCPLQIKFHIQACVDKRQKYVSGADGAERFNSNRRDVDSDTAGLTAGVREPRRGDLHLLVNRAHRLRLPGVWSSQQTRRLQQTGLPGTTQRRLSRK